MTKDEALKFLQDEGYNAGISNGVLMVYVTSPNDIVITSKELGVMLRTKGYRESFGVLNNVNAESGNTSSSTDSTDSSVDSAESSESTEENSDESTDDSTIPYAETETGQLSFV